MRAKKLSDLLKKKDRVAVSNITGREASKVCAETMKYSPNIVGGWALGKAGQNIHTSGGPIPVFATYKNMMQNLPADKKPNKIVIYSPPGAVYGEVKEVVEYSRGIVETIFVITEHVSIEVTAKIHQICKDANIDLIGCNTLGMINVYDHVRVGAVGGDTPEESFRPGSVSIFSNSGNMVNTIATYLKASGMGISYGVSTGKDTLILTPMKELLPLAERDPNTKIVVLYVEPGGVYEQEAIDFMIKKKFSKPVVVYVAGMIAEKHTVSLGHAGAVVEGAATTATAKMKAFDEYFGNEPFDPKTNYKKMTNAASSLKKGIRVNTLHDVAKAVGVIADALNIERNYSDVQELHLNPWFVNLKKLKGKIPEDMMLEVGDIPENLAIQFKKHESSKLGITMNRVSMKNSSHASSNDGAVPRIYGYSLMDLMEKRSFVSSIILYWTGELPRTEFEEKLAEMTFIAALTNGPGTISAIGAKTSTSAGNMPNTAMIGTLASIGLTHGGNGAKAVSFLLDVFKDEEIDDPYDCNIDIKSIAKRVADDFKAKKEAAKEASLDYEKIPCLGHPVFNKADVNYDPREVVIYNYMKEQGKINIFLEFYHELTRAMKDNGTARRVFAVNVDGAIASVWLGICWRHLREKTMTLERAIDIPFIAFALGRTAGGAGEYLDHKDYGTGMDMRVPVKECKSFNKPRSL
jgi:succinyl-CoA synthetase alpha subunit/citrate synthase